MRRLFLVIVAVLISWLVTPALIFGQTTEPSSPASSTVASPRPNQERIQQTQQKSQEIRELKQERRTEVQQGVKERVATRQAQAKTRTIEHIKNVFLRILGRLNIALQRLDNIASRLQLRIDKLKALGVDTSAAAKALADCGSRRATAVDKIAGSTATVSSIDTSGDVHTAATTASRAMVEAKQALIAYRVCLSNVVVLVNRAQAQIAAEKLTDYILQLNAMGDCANQALLASQAVLTANQRISAVNPADPDTQAEVKMAVEAILTAERYLTAYNTCIVNAMSLLKSAGVDVLAVQNAINACKSPADANVMTNVAISSGSEGSEASLSVGFNASSLDSARKALLDYQKCLDSALAILKTIMPKEATGSAQ